MAARVYIPEAAGRSRPEPAGGAGAAAVGKRTLVDPVSEAAGPARAAARPASGASPPAPHPIEALFAGAVQLRAARGEPTSSGGEDASSALPRATQARMERSFGADFSSVRVHEGPAAPGLGAEAYTQGESVHFAPGRFQPGTPAGDQLIGHELAHVVQQRAERVPMPQTKGAPIQADDGLEREADEQGARAARGEPAGAQGPAEGAAASAGPVQRKSLLDPIAEKGFEDKKRVETKLMSGGTDGGVRPYLAKALIGYMGMVLDYKQLAQETEEHDTEEVPAYAPQYGETKLQGGPIPTASGEDLFAMAMTMAAILKNAHRAELREIAKLYAADKSGDERMATLLGTALTPEVERTLLLLGGGSCGDTTTVLSGLYLDPEGPQGLGRDEGRDPAQWRNSTVLGLQRGVLATQIFNPGEPGRKEQQLQRYREDLLATEQALEKLTEGPQAETAKQELQEKQRELKGSIARLERELATRDLVSGEAKKRGIVSGVGVGSLAEVMAASTAPLLAQINISIAAQGMAPEHIGFNHSYVIEQHPRGATGDPVIGSIYQSYIGNHSLSKWTHGHDTRGELVMEHLDKVRALTRLPPEAVEKRNQLYKELYFLQVDPSYTSLETEQSRTRDAGRLEIVWCTHPINEDIARKNVDDLIDAKK